MRFWSFPIIRISAFLIIGIITYRFLYFEQVHLIYILAIGLLLLVFLNKYLKQTMSTFYGPDLIIYLSLSLCGYLLAFWHDPLNHQNHYTKYIADQETLYSVEMRVDQSIKNSAYHHRYIAKIISVNHHNCHGTVLLNLPTESLTTTLNNGQLIEGLAKILPVDPPRNPHQFNYKAFLKNRYIHHGIYPEIDHLKLTGIHSSVLSTIKGWRDLTIKNLEQFDIDAEEKGVILALLLGQRQEISKELYRLYSRSGAVHILAISGLHVGIILMMLHFLLKPLDYLKRGNILRMIIILMFLWIFAVITGLSPSVCRAVTMFSLLTISMNMNRPANSYNTLALSMFILLLFNPNFIYETGFQMSYLAVISILMFNPVFMSIWRPKFRIIRTPWQIFSVSLSAQIGVLPLSLYYFNQFPGLFFLTNLVIIPFLSLILSLGFIVLGLAFFNLLDATIMDLYTRIIALMNDFIQWVSGFESFIFEGIPFNLPLVFLCYALILCSYAFLTKPNPRFIIATLIALVVFRSGSIYKAHFLPSNTFVVFHKSRETIIGLKTGRELTISASSKELIESENLITDFIIGEQIRHIEFDSFKSFYGLPVGKLLVLDSFPVYNLRAAAPDWVLLRNSPKLNLDRLIDSLKPGLVICDGSNYRSYRQRWKQSCLNKKIPFHSTDERGAFMIRF